ncbi:MAG: alpha/beta hydrolase [Gemmataceae bacterium]
MASDRPYRPAPELQQVLDDLARLGNPLDTMTRDNVAGLWFLRELLVARPLAPLPLAEVRDTWVPVRNRQIPVRLYVPDDAGLVRAGRRPLLVYYHGGGWSLGSIATYDSLCRGLARLSGAAVLSVDYRLAPEFPFPAGLEDAHLALEWAYRNADLLAVDRDRLVVGGDSAGGNLATVVAMRLAKERLPLRLQLLIYPSTDIGRTDTASFRQYGRRPLADHAAASSSAATTPDPAAVVDAGGGAAASGRRRPGTAAAGADPDWRLRSAPRRGAAYAERLRAVGVPVDYRLEPELIHAGISLYNKCRLYPAASRRVEPILAGLATAVRAALTA